MDIRIFVGGLIVSLQSILSLTTAGTAYNCRMCKPGYYASRMCSRTYDTVCKPCSKGTFSALYNTYTSCLTCSKCAVGQFVIEECSHSSDTKCAPCDSIKESFSVHFKIECLQQDEALRINISDSEGIDLKKSGTDSTDVYESSSVPEGSGVDLSESVDVTIYPLVNGTEEEESDGDKEELEEGSGELSVIQTTPQGLNATTIKPVILTDEEKEITEATSTKVTQTSTVRTGIIIPVGGGVILKNATTKVQPDVILEDTPDDVTVYVDETNVNEPKAGASQKKDTGGDTAGASVGVVITVGLVTAFVFFVLGFLASRVWNGRRERTFNVLEAERRNGKPPVECSGIEYKDPENNLTKPTSVYDEIPLTTKVNGSGAESKPNISSQNTDSAPPIYSKPVKKSTAPPTGAPPPKAPRTSNTDEGTGNWAGFAFSRNPSSGSLILNSQPERPVSEIKYIDEGSDDEKETDKLLPQPPSADDSTNSAASTSENATGSQPDTPTQEDNKVEQDTSDEQTPMLPKDGSSGQS